MTSRHIPVCYPVILVIPESYAFCQTFSAPAITTGPGFEFLSFTYFIFFPNSPKFLCARDEKLKVVCIYYSYYFSFFEIFFLFFILLITVLNPISEHVLQFTSPSVK